MVSIIGIEGNPDKGTYALHFVGVSSGLYEEERLLSFYILVQRYSKDMCSIVKFTKA